MIDLIQILTIISSSWPIAAIVVGVATAVTVRRSLKQVMDNTARQNEYHVSNAVTVPPARNDY